MHVLYVTQKGARITRQRGRFRVLHKGNLLMDIPAIHISQILIFRWATLTSAALALAIEHKIPVFYLHTTGRIQAFIQPWENRNVPLRLQQYAWATHPERARTLATAFVEGKIHNMRVLLQQVIVHPVLRQKVTYRRAIELQARCLVKTLLEEIPEYVPFRFR